MIRVNLLPSDQSSRRRPAAGGGPPAPGGAGSPMISLLSVVIALVLIGGSGFASYYKWNEANTVRAELEEKQDTKKKLERTVKEKGQEYEALKEKYARAIRKIQVLLMLDPPDRLLWAEKLNMIADLRPDGVAVTTMELREKVDMIETPESLEVRAAFNKVPAAERRGRKEPQPVKVPIIRQTFTVRGVAYDPQQSNRLTHIKNFYDALLEYFRKMEDGSIRRFMDGFQQEPPPTYGDMKDIENYLKTGRRVTEFVITIETKAIGQEKGEVLLERMNKDAQRRREQAEKTGIHRRRTPGAEAAPAAS